MSDSSASPPGLAAPQAATTPQAAAAPTATAMDDPSWRLPGQTYRSSLLSEDEHTGGSHFVLNPTVPITKYYQVSRRAYHQFRDSCGYLNEHNVDEVYLMGNRLIKFLTSTLPQHSQYGSSHEELIEARDEVKLVLVDAGRLLGEVALYIDRLEWDRYQNEGGGDDEEASPRLRRRRRIMGVGNGDADEYHDDDDEEASEDDESCSDEDEGSELESIIEEEDEDEDDQTVSDTNQDDIRKRPDEAWEADFSSAANAFDGPTMPHDKNTQTTSTNTAKNNNSATSPTKTTKSILQTPTATPTPTPRKKNRHRRVKFSPDVKPGKHHPPPPPVQMASNLTAAHDDNDDDDEYYHDQDDLDERNNMSTSLEDEEHQSFLQMTQMEFVVGGSFDDGDDDGLVVLGGDRGSSHNQLVELTAAPTEDDAAEEDDDGNDDGDDNVSRREEEIRRRRKAWEIVRARNSNGNDNRDGKAAANTFDTDNDDASIDDDAVLAAATDGIPLSPVHSPSRPARIDTVDRADRALSDLTKATQALSVRVRRFETEEVDDVPTDEEHTDDEGARDVDEFATAPGINDLSRSSILYESDNDNNDDHDEDDGDGSAEGQGNDIDNPEDLRRYRSNQNTTVEGSSERLSFMHAVAIQNFHSDFHRSMAVEDDEDEIMAHRRLHQDHDDNHDSDAADSWAQDGGDGDDDDDFDTTSASENGDGRHDFGGDGFLQSELGFDGPLPTFPSDGRDPFFLDKEAPWPDQVEEFNPFDIGASHGADGIKSNRARTESASGTDADETAQTMPSSSNSYEYSGDLPSLSLGTSTAKQDNRLPDKLDYLESKLRALKQERLSEDHVVGDDEVEV